MLDDSSNRLIWIAVGLALIFGMFETYNGTIPKIIESVTSTTQATIPVEHTAYAYSADGTDRFSTVYPNLNLLSGSTKYTKDSPKIVTSNKSDNDFHINDVYVKNLKAGTYTMSGEADAPWCDHSSTDRQEKVGLWLVSTTPNLDVNINLGKTVPKTFNVPKDGDYEVRVNTYSDDSTLVTHKFWNFKLEQGSTATTWMPSGSEVKDSDYPTYVGTFTDHSLSASNDPTKYTWKERN